MEISIPRLFLNTWTRKINRTREKRKRQQSINLLSVSSPSKISSNQQKLSKQTRKKIKISISMFQTWLNSTWKRVGKTYLSWKCQIYLLIWITSTLKNPKLSPNDRNQNKRRPKSTSMQKRKLRNPMMIMMKKRTKIKGSPIQTTSGLKVRSLQLNPMQQFLSFRRKGPQLATVQRMFCTIDQALAQTIHKFD